MSDRTKKYSENMPLRIKSLREAKGMTQKTLAQKLYKSESAIRMWELGRSEPDCETVNNLSYLFDVTADYILGKTFAVTREMECWTPAEKNIFEKASAASKEYLLFLYGHGCFGTDSHGNYTDENADENTVIYFHNGKRIKKQISPSQMEMLAQMIDGIKENDYVEVFAAASSDNNQPPRVEKISRSVHDKLINAPDTDDELM